MTNKDLNTTSPESPDGWHHETWVYRGRRLNTKGELYLEFQRIDDSGSLVGPEFGYPRTGMPRDMQVGQLVAVYTNGQKLRIGGEDAPRLTTGPWFVDEREKWVGIWIERDRAAMTQKEIARQAKHDAERDARSRTIASVKEAYDNAANRNERAAIIAQLIEEVTRG